MLTLGDMVKKITVVLMIALLFSGCGKTENVESVNFVNTDKVAESIEQEKEKTGKKPIVSEESVPVELSEEEKLKAQIEVAESVISEFIAGLESYQLDRYYFTLADFNQDGRMEIVIAMEGGSGHYTYFSIYEVNDDYKTAKKIEEFDYSDYVAQKSAPDIIRDEWYGIYDPETEDYKYYIWDIEVDGAMVSCRRLKELSFGETKGIKNVLVIKNDEPSDESVFLDSHYYDVDRNEISEEEYDKQVADLENNYNIAYRIDWLYIDELQSDKTLREEQLIDLYKGQKIYFGDSVEVYAQETSDKLLEEMREYIPDYNGKPSIIDRTIIKTDKGDLYHFHIDLDVALLWGYIVEETPEGVQTVYDYEYSARSRYNLYEGGYIQHIGSNSAASWGEDLCQIDDTTKSIYSYESEPFKDYLEWRYKRDFGKESNIVEKMKDAGMTDSDVFGTLMQRMTVGDKHIWLLEFYNGAPESVKNMAYDAVAVSDIPDNIMVCREEEDFIEKCKAELKRQGYDIDKIFENLLVGERESWIWGKPYTDDVLYKGRVTRLGEVFEFKPVFYSTADVCGDETEEDAYLSHASIYVIDKENNKVVYEGSSYEKLLNWNGHKGIIYQRDGGAPAHTNYQYIVLDENGEGEIKCTWALYDGNEDGIFDAKDYYEFNDKEVSYNEWKELTAEYMEMAKHTVAWKEIEDPWVQYEYKNMWGE